MIFMSTEEIKALGRRLVEGYNKGKAAAIAAMDEVYATDIVFHGTDGTEIHGLKDYKDYNGLFYGAFPDAHFTIDDVVVEADKGAWLLTLTGTFKTELHGIQPTKK
jgi:predicted ester cyclase